MVLETEACGISPGFSRNRDKASYNEMRTALEITSAAGSDRDNEPGERSSAQVVVSVSVVGRVMALHTRAPEKKTLRRNSRPRISWGPRRAPVSSGMGR